MSYIDKRRQLLKSALALVGGGIALPALGAVKLPLTPSCGQAEELTLAQTEGPYFSPNTPLKQDFSADDPHGRPFLLQGLVLDTHCRPQAKALVELWHADSQGHYDNEGYRLRGHIFTDAQGRFQFKTVMPGIYPGRTRHFHLKVQRQGGRVLTTQLYFPQESLNARDGIYDPSLLMQLGTHQDMQLGQYQFIVA
ncbi:hypothetical protein [Thiofilum flexile]|uniref:dioxygenase family protein n=1 Tax=Thiofilum flexile TaxID=125627 RepID=UPI0003637E1A|nr:hypothetical protein [Thiofilum flexile]